MLGFWRNQSQKEGLPSSDKSELTSISSESDQSDLSSPHKELTPKPNQLALRCQTTEGSSGKEGPKSNSDGQNHNQNADNGFNYLGIIVKLTVLFGIGYFCYRQYSEKRELFKILQLEREHHQNLINDLSIKLARFNKLYKR